jgi:hypothetical protein
MTVDLPAIVGRNAKMLRGAATLDDVAKAARRYGLKNWGTGRVSDLEHGRVSPTVQTLVALALALAEVRGDTLTLGDLVNSDERIALTGDLTVTNTELQGFLAGGVVSLDERYLSEIVDSAKGAFSPEVRQGWPPRLDRVRVGLMRQVNRDYGEPETLLARDLGLDRQRLVAEMAALWAKSYGAERNLRAGPAANAQKKGRVARELKAELKAVLDGES